MRQIQFRSSFKEKFEFDGLPDDSSDMFHCNYMLDRYLDRPNKTFKLGQYQII